METLLCIFSCVLLLTIILYMSGCFETWVVKNCTNCGEFCPKGTLPVCHMFSMALDRKVRTPLHNIFRIGVTHDHLLCSTCHDAAMKITLYRSFPRPSSKTAYEEAFKIWRDRREGKAAEKTH